MDTPAPHPSENKTPSQSATGRLTTIALAELQELFECNLTLGSPVVNRVASMAECLLLIEHLSAIVSCHGGRSYAQCPGPNGDILYAHGARITDAITDLYAQYSLEQHKQQNQGA